MIVWPELLPFGIKYGASHEFGKGAKITTDMDYGNRRRRQRFTNVPSYQQVSLSFKDEQLSQFLSFYIEVLKNGTLSFYAPVIVASSIEYKRCTIDDESMTITYGDYNYNTVELKLEMYDNPGYSPGAMWFIATYGEDFLIEFENLMHYPVHVHYPAEI